MKRVWVWLTALALLTVLCGCGAEGHSDVYDVDYNGKTYTVDQEQGTITCGGVVYRFEVSGRGGDSVNFTVTYPDGAQYSWNESGQFGYGGWSGDYDPESKGYVTGDVLWDVLSLDRAARPGGSPLAGLFLLALGGLLAAAPRLVWMLEYGWRFKSVEPSDLALVLHRGAGVVLLFVGAVYLLASLF